MRISIIAVGKKIPSWAQAGVNEYLKRLQREYELTVVEIANSLPGTASDKNLKMKKEADAILGKTKLEDYVVALDLRGARLSTSSMALKLDSYRALGRDLVFVIGGADGLHKRCLERAEESWSLSDLTLPHSLARVVLIEQLYRANSIHNGHPYHRE